MPQHAVVFHTVSTVFAVCHMPSTGVPKCQAGRKSSASLEPHMVRQCSTSDGIGKTCGSGSSWRPDVVLRSWQLCRSLTIRLSLTSHADVALKSLSCFESAELKGRRRKRLLCSSLCLDHALAGDWDNSLMRTGGWMPWPSPAWRLVVGLCEERLCASTNEKWSEI